MTITDQDTELQQKWYYPIIEILDFNTDKYEIITNIGGTSGDTIKLKETMELVIPQSVVIDIPENKFFLNEGIITNNGTINIVGTITNTTLGTINNKEGGTIINPNTGAIINDEGVIIYTILATINNEEGGTIINEGVINIAHILVNNDGTIRNGGTITRFRLQEQDLNIVPIIVTPVIQPLVEEVGQVINVRISNTITKDFNTSKFYAGHSLNYEDYLWDVTRVDPTSRGFYETLGPDWAEGGYHWKLEYVGPNPSSYPLLVEGVGSTKFLESIYKITYSREGTSFHPSQDIGIGGGMFLQLGPVDSNERFIQLISRTGNLCEVYIYAMIDGLLHYLEGTYDGDSGFWPNALDDHLTDSWYSTPIWYPVSNGLQYSELSNSVWTLEIAEPNTDQFGNEVGQSMTARFSNDILQADGTTIHFTLEKWRSTGNDYLIGPDYGEGRGQTPGKSEKDWDIVWETTNASYPTNVTGLGYTGFLEYTYKIEILPDTGYEYTLGGILYPTRKSVGQISRQGATANFYNNSSTGETTDNGERFIQLLSRNGNTCEVYIFAYINGVIHYLEGRNENEVGYHPYTLDPSIQMRRSLTLPLWYPVTNQLWSEHNSSSKWTMEIQPSPNVAP